MTHPRFNPFAFPQWLRPAPYGPMAPDYDPRTMPHPGAPQVPAWYQGMAPVVPEPTAASEQPGGAPAGYPVDWTAAGAKPRPLVADWRPPEEELSRWGVLATLDVQANQAPSPGAELTRVTLPIPGGCVVMVWVNRLTADDPAGWPTPEFQVLAGIGTVNVPVTQWVALDAAQQDGVARVLAPEVVNPSGPPLANPALYARFPAKWVSVNYRVTQVPAFNSRVQFGCIVAPVTSMF